MCGIFAFHGIRLDHTHLARAATGAARRGPHGHGWVAITADTVHHHHALGPLQTPLADVPTAAVRVLGHGRLATVGPVTGLAGLQPFTAGGHWLAHNGNVYNPDTLAPGAITDSHALALAYAAARDTGLDAATALKQLADAAEQHAWVIVALDADGHLYGHRNRHPLYACATDHGTYWSSWPCCPAARMLPELATFTTAGGP